MLGLLVDRYGTSLQVRVELAAGRVVRYAGLEAVEAALSAGAISQAGPMDTAERELFAELLRTFGAGEASCIALALQRGGMVVTDDRTARRRCASHGIRVTGTIGILRALCADRIVSAEEADAVLSSAVSFSFINSLSETPVTLFVTLELHHSVGHYRTCDETSQARRQ